LGYFFKKRGHFRGQLQPGTGHQKRGLSPENGDVWSPYLSYYSYCIVTHSPLTVFTSLLKSVTTTHIQENRLPEREIALYVSTYDIRNVCTFKLVTKTKQTPFACLISISMLLCMYVTLLMSNRSASLAWPYIAKHL